MLKERDLPDRKRLSSYNTFSIQFLSQGYQNQQQLSCQSKSEESCCSPGTLQHLFGKAGSTFVATRSIVLGERVKVLWRSVALSIQPKLFTAKNANDAK